jgi:hypothetical protein
MHECIAEEGSDFGDGSVESGIVVAHERPLWETIHDDLSLAVKPASGGLSLRGVLPRSLTTYVGSKRSVRLGAPLFLEFN